MYRVGLCRASFSEERLWVFVEMVMSTCCHGPAHESVSKKRSPDMYTNQIV